MEDVELFKKLRKHEIPTEEDYNEALRTIKKAIDAGTSKINKEARKILKHIKSCQRCEYREDPTILEVHHKLPILKGGNNNKNNIIKLCPNCHRVIHKELRQNNNRKKKEKPKKSAIT